MKVIIIGCTHAGTAAAVRIKALYQDVDIVVYERNDHISFLSCGIALNIGGTIESTKQLFCNSPQRLEELGVIMKMNHDVQYIDFKNKKIEVKDLKSGRLFEDTYDKLILTMGSWPVIPKVSGIEYKNIDLCKNYYHGITLIEKAKFVQKVIIVGAGYIGVELAEAFQRAGKKVILMDTKDRIMSQYLDQPFTHLAEETLKANGITLALVENVQAFKGKEGKVTQVITDKGRYEADLVVLCAGFKPNTDLVQDQLTTLSNGAIIVDDYMRTSEIDVFAGGDCCCVYLNPAQDYRYIPLATHAVRMGTLIAENLMEPRLRYMGTQGTSGIKVYDYKIASTGLTEEKAKAIIEQSIKDKDVEQDGVENRLENTKKVAMQVSSVIIEEAHGPDFMVDSQKTLLKLVFDKESGKILGGQMASKYDITEMINTLSVVIQNQMTVDELALTDFFFQPWFNKPWGLLNQVALAAREQIEHVKQKRRARV